MLAHGEIIVQTPYRDLTRTVRMMVPGAREDARLVFQVRKYAIPTFAMEAFGVAAENGLRSSSGDPAKTWWL